MTKQPTDEMTLKCHLAIEEGVKLNPGVTEIMENNTLAIQGAHFNSVIPGNNVKPKLARAKTRMNLLKSKLGKVVHKLYDLESSEEPEKTLNIDLCLYQMERP